MRGEPQGGATTSVGRPAAACRSLRYPSPVPQPVRVMIEQGKKRAVACAFDWPGWDRSARSESDALAALESYRARYAKVAALAGFAAEFGGAGDLDVVERLKGTGTTDFHGVSAVPARPELGQMSEPACEQKIALLRACWEYFDAVAARVSPELRKGPRGGGRDRDRIVRHTNGAEIGEFARKVGVVVPLETVHDPAALGAYRDVFSAALREHNARGAPARSWALQFLIRRCAYHMLDHAWEMEDRDQQASASGGTEGAATHSP
jgi:hypothetical protein